MRSIMPKKEPGPEKLPTEPVQAAETPKRRFLQVEVTPEDEALLEKHGFKSGGSLLKSWREASGELNPERDARKGRDQEFQALREQMAELRGSVKVLTEPKPEPQAPRLTDEQLAELAQQD